MQAAAQNSNIASMSLMYMPKRRLFSKTFDSINEKIKSKVAESADDLLDVAVDASSKSADTVKSAGKKVTSKASDVTRSSSRNLKQMASGTTDIDTLEKLGHLKERGLITEEEYIEAKKRILERL